jgi:predicted RNase H-like HicB family nuclease
VGGTIVVKYGESKEMSMKIRVVIEYDEEVKSYSAVCPELPGCTSCGDTEDEAMENIKEAIQLYLEPDGRDIKPTAKVYEVAL